VSEAAGLGLLQRALLALAAGGVVLTAVELASLRHWNGGEQMIPWFTLAALAVGIAARFFGRGRRAATRAAIAAALASIGSTVIGVYEHAHANYEAAPLDYRYATKWVTMSEPSRWWAAVSGAVGPSPVLAPAAMAFVGICLWLSTVPSGDGTIPATSR